MALEKTIGPYQIVRPLGKGGMGEVSLAYDTRLNRHVALKALLAGKSAGDMRTRLIREARAAAALSHPGIASIFDILDDGESAFIVMEFVEGRTLAEAIEQQRPSPAEALNYIRQLCDAVDAAHERGIIHRDLKPANVMVGVDGRLKILDFGLARERVTADQPTQTGTLAKGIVGTVGYIAPEQLLGRMIDHRADIYALGTIAFQLLTWRLPFEERDPLAYALAATAQDAPLADTIEPTLGRDVAIVLSRALARDPQSRYGSARQLARDLDSAVGGTAISTGPVAVAPAPAPRRRLWMAASAIASLIAVGAAGFALRSPARPTPGAPVPFVVTPTMSRGGSDASISAAGLNAVLLANLSQVRDLSVIRAVDAPVDTSPATIGPLLQKLDGRWGLHTAVTTNGPRWTIAATLTQRDLGAAAWEGSFTGDAVSASQQLLEGVAAVLVRKHVIDTLPDAQRVRLLTLPTRDSQAMQKYSEARLRLNGANEAGDAREAARLLEDAVARDPSFALAFAALSDAYSALYSRTKDAAFVAQAQTAAEQALTLDPTQGAVQVTLAQINYQTGHLDQALQATDRAITLQPSNDAAYRLRGRILAQQGKTEPALDSLDRAIALRPNNASHHENKAFILYRASRYAEAADEYRRVVALSPDYANGYQMLGTSLHRLGDISQAIGNYEHAVRLGPNPETYSNLALSYYDAGRFEDALKAYQESARRDPHRPMVHRNLGDVFEKLGRRRDAEAAYVAAIDAANARLAVNPQDADTIGLVALCEAKLNRGRDAERHIAEAQAIRPDSVDVAARAAEVYAILRQLDRSIQSLKAAISLGLSPTVARANEELRNLRQLPAFVEVTSANRGPTPQGGR